MTKALKAPELYSKLLKQARAHRCEVSLRALRDALRDGAKNAPPQGDRRAPAILKSAPFVLRRRVFCAVSKGVSKGSEHLNTQKKLSLPRFFVVFDKKPSQNSIKMLFYLCLLLCEE